MEEQANYETGQLTPGDPFKVIGAAVKQMAAEAVKVAVEDEKAVVSQDLEAMKQAIEQACKTTLEEGRKTADSLSSLFVVAFKNKTSELINEKLKQSGIEILREKVSAIPRRIMVSRDAIDEKRQALRTTRQSLSDAEQSVKEAEAALMAEIAGESFDGALSGKPKFSNDKARGAELIKRKREDRDYLAAYQTYQGVKRQVEEAENELATYDTELKCLENEFTAAVAQLKSVTAEIGFYAAALGAAGEVRF